MKMLKDIFGKISWNHHAITQMIDKWQRLKIENSICKVDLLKPSPKPLKKPFDAIWMGLYKNGW